MNHCSVIKYFSLVKLGHDFYHKKYYVILIKYYVILINSKQLLQKIVMKG